MIYCKRHIIAAGFMLMLPLTGWSEAPVVDDSENFAIIEGQAQEAPVVGSKYDDPQIESGQFDLAQNDNYTIDNSQDEDGPALAKDDHPSDSENNLTDNAKLIDKIQSLQQEIQELRGQLEVQAHDLKLLQQQQVAFYKDLDARLSGNSSSKLASSKPPIDLDVGSKDKISTPAKKNDANAMVTTPVSAPVSRANPADEQISYLAAYELIKNKRYDDAITAMNVFVQKYPKGGYTANAQYWLGELYLVKKDYSKSIEHFNTVLQQFPTSSKSAASMLKVGYAYAEQGNKQEAKKFLQQVVRAYPNTPTAQLASSKLRTI
ncbi:tol-pal system protein YbgF [Legionella longbeachae]|uniref:Cell division coordinator CpoB n=1 Tax=Legionella longbeachae serogroup 1 (strain NSW150) TaxID=661367 RepID=D3HJ92_LEGLN|nr:tol-pal system protein YbgF [Legionella longbeachae]VEE02981.1 outer membrane protein [Legionella oakridgensis]ARB90787.1 tol-pal system protein YbgF [Legionella longbeachae]EEZ94417.1 tetratricopeptide repeat protein [Legionella longbeachae D-4968]QIN32713.1 tol-pal system protein YbgF [Legionella longbeachae]QIN36065.1 tol-pal system protein YbgF [Legionella longbeachae]